MYLLHDSRVGTGQIALMVARDNGKNSKQRELQ